MNDETIQLCSKFTRQKEAVREIPLRKGIAKVPQVTLSQQVIASNFSASKFAFDTETHFCNKGKKKY